MAALVGAGERARTEATASRAREAPEGGLRAGR